MTADEIQRKVTQRRTYEQYMRQEHGVPLLADDTPVEKGKIVYEIRGSGEYDEYGEYSEFKVVEVKLTGECNHDDGHWYVETYGHNVLASRLYPKRKDAKAWILALYQKEKDEIDAKIARLQ